MYHRIPDSFTLSNPFTSLPQRSSSPWRRYETYSEILNLRERKRRKKRNKDTRILFIGGSRAEIGRRSLMEPGCVISQRPVVRTRLYARYYRGGGGGGRRRGLSLKALKIISGESCAHAWSERGEREGRKQGEGGGRRLSLRGLLNFDDR